MNVSCKSITKIFPQSVQALSDFSLEIKSGEFIVVMGESGCGKSTLLKVLSGVLTVDSGELSLDGIPANNIPPQERDCAMIFQNYALYPNYTVYDNVAFYMKSKNVPTEQINKKVLPVLEFFGLSDYKNVKPKFLSGGQQQRVCLAKALVRKPKLLLFDEPLSNVDEQAREDYVRLIKETKKLMKDTTFIYVTHNSHEARFLADKIAIMVDGRIEDYGTLDELLKYPQVKDTLYMLCGSEIENQDGYVENGKYCGSNYDKNLPEIYKTAYKGQTFERVACVSDVLKGNNDYFFSQDGKILFGVKKEIKLKAYKKDNKIIYNEQSIVLSEEQQSRLICDDGDIYLSLSVNKLRKHNLFDDLKIKCEKVLEENGKYLYSDGSNFFFLPFSAEKELYYGVEDINLTDKKGNKVLVKFPVKSNCSDGRVGGGTLYLGKDKFDSDLKSGFYDLKFELDSCIKTVGKKGRNCLFISECIGEDYLGDVKIAYCISPYFNDYVTFKIPSNLNLLKRKKFYMLIDTKKIKAVKGDLE